jgi:uncharacterized protein DUF4325
MNDKTTINVASIIGPNIDHDDGRRVYESLQAAFRDGKSVRLDLRGLDIITPSFLNTSLRPLAKEYGADFLKAHLEIANSNATINRMLREAVTENEPNRYPDRRQRRDDRER